MRIAFLIGQFPALSETFILDQITTLIDRGHTVRIFSERRGTDARVHSAVEEYGLLALTRYEQLPVSIWSRFTALWRLWSGTRSHWRALDVLRHGRDAASLRLLWAAQWMGDDATFDVIQCHFGALGRKAVQLRAIGALSGPIATALHGEDIINYPKRFADTHYDALFESGDLFLPISARWNDTLAALGCPIDRLVVHRMGVDLEEFQPRGTDPEPVRILRLLLVGRLVEKKGIEDAIRAASQLQCEYEFVIAGDGPLRVSLEALAAQLSPNGAIRFIGARHRYEVRALMQSSDVFLSPSRTAADGDIEGVPVAIMEAMASALPVVSTRHSGIPELVHDDVSGYLVDEGDVHALTDRVSRLAADAALRTRMGRAGRRIVANDWDIRVLTERLESHYRTLRRSARSAP
ncbi:glycosyltransferase [Gemmatimonas sp.]|uniref:glycosyltransferase n=1 Tax=Gemmatimonas sp. TaxID=1962908 RepID=UPI00286A2BFE|nr:glycosyltransferase [Gemmatimonas sp.]